MRQPKPTGRTVGPARRLEGNAGPVKVETVSVPSWLSVGVRVAAAGEQHGPERARELAAKVAELTSVQAAHLALDLEGAPTLLELEQRTPAVVRELEQRIALAMLEGEPPPVAPRRRTDLESVAAAVQRAIRAARRRGVLADRVSLAEGLLEEAPTMLWGLPVEVDDTLEPGEWRLRTR